MPAGKIRMAITFTVDPSKRAIFAAATGIVSRQDVLDHLQSKVGLRVTAFHELFDARNVTLDLSSNDLVVIAKAVREALGDEAPGRNAIVTDNAFIYGLAKTYADLTGREASDFQVF